MSNWDEAYWASSLEVVKQWSSPAAWEGRWFSTKIKIASQSLAGQFMASVLMYEKGTGL